MSEPQSISDVQRRQPAFLPALDKYLESSARRYDGCITEVSHNVPLSSPQATIHFQYVKFNPADREPKFDVLAKVLVRHVVKYSLSARTRKRMAKEMEAEEDGDLFLLARDYFRKVHDAGEVGELLLFFLLEAAFRAPQLVCKMELKTNSKDEVKGADGIHAKWDITDDHLDVYLGESKLHQSIYGALDSAFKSLTDFYDLKRMDEELQLVTSHFKHVDEDFQNAITQFISRESPDGKHHIVHACLIGWDWPQYKLLEGPEREKLFTEFDRYYLQYAPNIAKLVDDRIGKCKYKHLSFRFLFIPFKDVDAFRREFYRVLCGIELGSGDHRTVQGTVQQTGRAGREATP